MSPAGVVACMYEAGLTYTAITRETGWHPTQIRRLAVKLGLFHPRPQGRPQVPCSKRRWARAGCSCDDCRAHWRRLNETRRAGRVQVQRERKAGVRRKPKVDGRRFKSMEPTPPCTPRLWRCCGWLQQIPEGETARCGRCGVVPLFARPEPDLRQFRNGR